MNIRPINITWPSANAFLGAIALLTLGALAGAMVFYPVPTGNHDFMVFILGGITGAATGGTASKIADRITQTGPDASVKSSTTPPSPP